MDNFLVAAGFSGRSFVHAPATGLLMAEIVLDGSARSIVMSDLSIERFSRGVLRPEYYIIYDKCITLHPNFT